MNEIQGNRTLTTILLTALLSFKARIPNFFLRQIQMNSIRDQYISYKVSLFQLFVDIRQIILLQYLFEHKEYMGCNKSNEIASPVLFPLDGSKSKVFPQYTPSKGNSQDYQNETITAILRQLNQQNELIVRMQKQKEKQRIAQEQKFQQMKNQMKLEMMKNKQEEKKKQQLIIDQMKLEKQKIQQEKRRLQKMIDKKPKIDIPDNYKNIGKGVLNKGHNFCKNCINTLPRFNDYQPGLKKCACQGYGLIMFQRPFSLFNGKCEKCTYGNGDLDVQLCEECYGYGVLNA